MDVGDHPVGRLGKERPNEHSPLHPGPEEACAADSVLPRSERGAPIELRQQLPRRVGAKTVRRRKCHDVQPVNDFSQPMVRLPQIRFDSVLSGAIRRIQLVLRPGVSLLGKGQLLVEVRVLAFNRRVLG
jgi:hypothetical protein